MNWHQLTWSLLVSFFAFPELKLIYPPKEEKSSPIEFFLGSIFMLLTFIPRNSLRISFNLLEKSVMTPVLGLNYAGRLDYLCEIIKMIIIAMPLLAIFIIYNLTSTLTVLTNQYFSNSLLTKNDSSYKVVKNIGVAFSLCIFIIGFYCMYHELLSFTKFIVLFFIFIACLFYLLIGYIIIRETIKGSINSVGYIVLLIISPLISYYCSTVWQKIIIFISSQANLYVTSKILPEGSYTLYSLNSLLKNLNYYSTYWTWLIFAILLITLASIIWSSSYSLHRISTYSDSQD